MFFDKDVTDLNLGEAALLAGLPQAPTDYNPFLNPDGAKHRRNQVLDAMADQGYITFAKAQQNKRKGLGLERGYRYESRTQQYFFDFVQQELIDKLRRRRPRATAGSRSIRRSTRGCSRSPSRRSPRTRSPAPPQALVSTDVDTGEIIAMASSESYEDSQFNLAAQGRRQPGSSFKPYALTTAVDQGIDPDSTYYSAPRVDHALPERRLRRSVERHRRRRRLDEPALRRPRARSTPSSRSWCIDIGPENDGRDGEADGRHQPALGLRRRTCSGPAT